MFKLRLLLIVALFFATLFSVQNVNASTVNNTEQAPLLLTHTMVQTDIHGLQLLRLSDHPSLQAKAVTRLHQPNKKLPNTDYTAHQSRLTASNTFYFLHHFQNEPQYDVVFEFFAQPLQRQIFLSPTATDIISAWYTMQGKRKNSRLSYWKDANLLYKAANTYHV
ncbi:hypothetical protein J8L70_03465 [Pseudoalteromonas sp. MMG010]|uniref:hypothetical protein n=1 Tax=Pseudoalteromonas sp. MMG010 TaxID=2822685 RepID=UPI001B3A357F|nr:hypothetical protein [Pseudoalteromonas sp. MMG010]MBQ4832291.1 hypothetical protein [Pseudoalteromonas sp. MMG010]